MSETVAGIEGAAAPPPRKRRANLGTADAEEIFASFDTRILRRFFAYLKPHRALLFGAQAAVLISSLSAVAMPWVIGSIVNAAVGVVLIVGLAHLMSWPRHLEPHWVKALVEEGRETIDAIAHGEPPTVTEVQGS